MQLPYHSVQFRTDGQPAGERTLPEAVAFAAARKDLGATDLLVLAHGWNNDIEAAESRYTTLCDRVERFRADRGLPAGRLAVLGLLWPSVQWADDDAVAGGGLSVGGDAAQALTARIAEAVEDPAAAAELVALVPLLDTSASARGDFVDRLRRLLPPVGEVDDDDPPPGTLLTGDPDALFAATGEGLRDVRGEGLDSAPEGGGQDLPPGGFPVSDDQGGGAAGFGLPDLDLLDIGRQILNTTTYYTMKKRSGVVALRGLVPLLAALAPTGLRVHLVGHSFGARLVSMAAAHADTPIASVTLLQGAFSHRGFAPDNGSNGRPGAFRAALSGSLTGPVVVTHTHNDRAVGIAYAIASRLARQAGSSIGDAHDVYGGLGANGAVATAEADPGVLGDPASGYRPLPRRILDLQADATIANHGDVSNEAVANMLLEVVTHGWV